MTAPVHPLALLVDDNPLVLRSLEMLMQSIGWDVMQVHDATEALEEIEHRHFDLAIVDFKMPGMSGIELCRQIHLCSEHEAPIIFIHSGYLDAKGRQEAKQAGAQAILDKPAGRDEFIDLIRKHGLPCES